MEKNGPVTRSRMKKMSQSEEPKVTPNLPLPTTTRQVTRVRKTPSFSETFNGRLDWKMRHYNQPTTSTPKFDRSSGKEKIGKGKGPLAKVVASDIPQSQSHLDVSIISPIPKLTTESNHVTAPKQQNLPLKIKPLAQSEPTVISPIRKDKRSPLLEQQQVSSETAVLPPPEQIRSGDETPIIHNFDELLDKYGEDSTKENEDDLDLHLHVAEDPSKKKTYEPKKHTKFHIHTPLIIKEKRKKATAPKSRAHQQPLHRTRKDEKLDRNALEWFKRKNEEFEDILNFDLCVEKR